MHRNVREGFENRRIVQPYVLRFLCFSVYLRPARLMVLLSRRNKWMTLIRFFDDEKLNAYCAHLYVAMSQKITRFSNKNRTITGQNVDNKRKAGAGLKLKPTYRDINVHEYDLNGENSTVYVNKTRIPIVQLKTHWLAKNAKHRNLSRSAVIQACALTIR